MCILIFFPEMTLLCAVAPMSDAAFLLRRFDFFRGDASLSDEERLSSSSLLLVDESSSVSRFRFRFRLSFLCFLDRLSLSLSSRRLRRDDDEE